MVPTVIALIQCRRGRSHVIWMAFAMVPIIFGIFVVGLGVLDFFHRWLVDHDPIDAGIISFPVGLAIPFLWAGSWSLSQFWRNRAKRK
jgi:hypothetical protein